jgi:hypothetical protein
MNQVSLYDTPRLPLPEDSAVWLQTTDHTVCHLVRGAHAMPYVAPDSTRCNRIPSPDQVRPERLHDFFRSGYQTYPLFVARVPHVTLYSPLMIGFQGDALMRETVPPWRRHKPDFFLTLASYTQCRDEVFIDEPVAMLANYSHTNYYHWLTQCAANLELLRLAGVPETVRLLLPASSPPYALQTLALLGVPESRLLQPGLKRLQLRQLIYPSLLEEHGNGRLSPLLLDVFSRLAQSLGQPGSAGAAVYLSRQDTQARRILNEGDLIAALAREGVNSVSCSSLSVGEQIRMAQTARLVVSAHGAAMGNLGFTSAMTPVFEILPRQWGVSCFYSGSQLRHQPHYVCIEHQVFDPEAGHGMTMRVDVDETMRCLERFRESLNATAT